MNKINIHINFRSFILLIKETPMSYLQRQGSARHHPHGTIRTVHTTYAAALKTTTHPKTRCRKPYTANQHLIPLMLGVCTRNMSS